MPRGIGIKSIPERWQTKTGEIKLEDLTLRHDLRKFAIFTAAANFSLNRKIDQTLPLKGPEYVDVYTH